MVPSRRLDELWSPPTTLVKRRSPWVVRFLLGLLAVASVGNASLPKRSLPGEPDPGWLESWIAPEPPRPSSLLRHFRSPQAARELARGWRTKAQTSPSPEATADFIVAAHHLLSYDETGELLLILEHIYSGSEKLEVPPAWEYWLRSLAGRAFLLHGGRAAEARVGADAGSTQDGDPGKDAIARDLIWPAISQLIIPRHALSRQAIPRRTPAALSSTSELGCEALPGKGETANFCGNPSNAGFPAYRLTLSTRSFKELHLKDDQGSRDLIDMLEVLASDESTEEHASRELSSLLPKIRVVPKLSSWHQRLVASYEDTPPALPLPSPDEKMRVLASHLRDPLRAGATRAASTHRAHQILKGGTLEEKLALVCASADRSSQALSALLISHYAEEPLVAVRRAILWQKWQRGEDANELSLWADLEGDPLARTLASALRDGRGRALSAEQVRAEVRRLGLAPFVVASLGGRRPPGSARFFVRALDGCPSFARTSPDGRYLVKSQLFANESQDALASPPGP